MALAFKNHLGWSQEDRSKYISWQLAGECISTCLDQISLPRAIYQLLYQHINCFIQFQLQKNPQNRRGSIRDVGFMFCFRRRRWLFIDFFGKRVYPNAFFFLNELYNFFNFFFCLLLNCWGVILCWTLKSSFLVAITWTCLTLTCQWPPG